jgi:selenocysteine-specific elongation factor
VFVIGTAGHVDHGKSALVQALSGIDPDRLSEEKARGMTIDLGFAWLNLPSGNEVSIVDVPGHERFIKNMLAGAGGIDLALLVVAADEGVMPQTREHLAILDLLGIKRGLVALTKRDLVDREWADLVAADIEETLAGTTIDGSPVIACSSVTGEGLDDLLAAIDERLAETEPKRDIGRPRLPIDRAFTMQGFGTVVTGTLIDGSVAIGDEVEILPALAGGHLTSIRSRIRGLQSHRSRVEKALPGTRTAINIAGVDVADMHRGQVVARPGALQASLAVDVRLRALSSLERPLRHNLNVTFHSGSSETPARLRLLDGERVEPGEEGWAQVRLSRPAALMPGDRFVIRDANDTIGGGSIVAVQARRHPRNRPSVVAGLERRAAGSPAEAMLLSLIERGPLDAQAMAAASTAEPGLNVDAVGELVGDGRVMAGTGEGLTIYFATETFDALAARTSNALEVYHGQHSLRAGMPKEELRSRLEVTSRVFPALLSLLAERGRIKDEGSVVALPGWAPRLSAGDEAAAQRYLASLRDEPFSPPVDAAPSEEVVQYLAATGQVVDVGGVVFAAEAYDEMVRRTVEALQSNGSITLAQIRDMFGTSRRYCQAFLEYLDQKRITVRRGDERLLGREAGKIAAR